MLEFDLLRKASKKEAQERAGYDDAQWKEFYVRQTAIALAESTLTPTTK